MEWSWKISTKHNFTKKDNTSFTTHICLHHTYTHGSLKNYTSQCKAQLLHGKCEPKSWPKCYPVGLNVGKNQIIYSCHFKKYPSGIVARKLRHDVVGASATVSWRNKRPMDLGRDDKRVLTVGSRSSMCWALLVTDGQHWPTSRRQENLFKAWERQLVESV